MSDNLIVTILQLTYFVFCLAILFLSALKKHESKKKNKSHYVRLFIYMLIYILLYVSIFIYNKSFSGLQIVNVVGKVGPIFSIILITTILMWKSQKTTFNIRIRTKTRVIPFLLVIIITIITLNTLIYVTQFRSNSLTEKYQLTIEAESFNNVSDTYTPIKGWGEVLIEKDSSHINIEYKSTEFSTVAVVYNPPDILNFTGASAISLWVYSEGDGDSLVITFGSPDWNNFKRAVIKLKFVGWQHMTIQFNEMQPFGIWEPSNIEFIDFSIAFQGDGVKHSISIYDLKLLPNNGPIDFEKTLSWSIRHFREGSSVSMTVLEEETYGGYYIHCSNNSISTVAKDVLLPTEGRWNLFVRSFGVQEEDNRYYVNVYDSTNNLLTSTLISNPIGWEWNIIEFVAPTNLIYIQMKNNATSSANGDKMSDVIHLANDLSYIPTPHRFEETREGSLWIVPETVLSNVWKGQLFSFKYGIKNRESEAMSYDIDVILGGQKVYEKRHGVLNSEERVEEVVEFIPLMTGLQKLEVNLYRKGMYELPDATVYFWVDVGR